MIVGISSNSWRRGADPWKSRDFLAGPQYGGARPWAPFLTVPSLAAAQTPWRQGRKLR